MGLTLSGVLVDARQGVPTLEDIVISLSRMPRFAGHTRGEWTVLDHSAYCMCLASEKRYPELQLAMLLHDAHESITGDIPTPIKNDGIRQIQRALDVRIMDRYFPGGIAAYDRMAELVQEIDRRALAAEAVLVGPPTETDGWREKLFGVARPEDVAILEICAKRPAQPGGVLQAIDMLTARIRG